MLNYAESFQRSVRNELRAELQSGALLMSDGVWDLHTALISCILINFHYGCGARRCSLCVSLADEQTAVLAFAVGCAGVVRCRRCAAAAVVDRRVSSCGSFQVRFGSSGRSWTQVSFSRSGNDELKRPAFALLIGFVDLWSSWELLLVNVIVY